MNECGPNERDAFKKWFSRVSVSTWKRVVKMARDWVPAIAKTYADTSRKSIEKFKVSPAPPTGKEGTGGLQSSGIRDLYPLHIRRASARAFSVSPFDLRGGKRSDAGEVGHRRSRRAKGNGLGKWLPSWRPAGARKEGGGPEGFCRSFFGHGQLRHHAGTRAPTLITIIIIIIQGRDKTGEGPFVCSTRISIAVPGVRHIRPKIRS